MSFNVLIFAAFKRIIKDDDDRVSVLMVVACDSEKHLRHTV